MFKHLSSRAGPKLVRELSQKVNQLKHDHGHDRLHTSDVVVTNAFNLASKHVLHVVSPAHTKNYATAMTNSLSACYVRCLEAAVEQCKGRTIAIAGLADRLVRGGFDKYEAYHIGLRTIKRFLHNYPGKFETIIFVANTEEECAHVTTKIAPLYFPRTKNEQVYSSLTFQTKSPGDSTGAYQSSNRRVRVGSVVLDAGEAASPVPNPQRQAALRLAAVETPPPSASKFKLRDFPQLEKWTRNKICVRIRETFNTRDDQGNGSLYTLYSIRVAETPSLPGYTVWRRYSEFSTLRDAVFEEATNHRSAILGALASTPFPAKVWFGSMGTEVIEERQLLLDGYLRTLASQCTDRTMMQLRAFLTPNEADVARKKLNDDDYNDEEEEEENTTSFVRNMQDPMNVKKAQDKKKRTKSTERPRAALGNLDNGFVAAVAKGATRTVEKAIARPSDNLKMRRQIREAASGKSAYTTGPLISPNKAGGRSGSAVPKTKRPSGPRMHRTDRGAFDATYVAEGNRFITNDLL
jgi:O-acetyl-ADP-ribose deacetylase (regulator of RNase III)